MSGRNSATGNSALRVLFDGWPVAADPGSAAALHLFELLEALPPGLEPYLALPCAVDSLPAVPDLQVVLRSDGPVTKASRQLRWEQADLPLLARRTRADMLHLTTLRAPLASPVPSLVSPAEAFSQGAEGGGLAGRLARALGRGGFSQAAGLLWPADLPPPDDLHPSLPLFALPPRVHGSFLAPQPRLPGLPETYLYAPGPILQEHEPILQQSWQQVAGAIGEECGLLLTGCDSRFAAALADPASDSPVVHLPHLTIDQQASAVQHAAAVLLLAPPLPWGDPLLQALACARPVAAVEWPAADHRAGPAAYLTPPGDARLLASALITLLLEESVAESLIKAASQRAMQWGSQGFSERLGEIYRQVSRKRQAG